jgi:hypothetical protein
VLLLVHRAIGLAVELFVTRQQPLHRFPKLTTNFQEHSPADLSLTMFNERQIALADAYPSCEVRLRHLESTQLSDPSPDAFPINVDSL